MNVKVVERSQQIKVMAQEIIRKEKELEANVRKPAEAQKYKEEKNAEANRNKIILEAEAEAEAIKVSVTKCHSKNFPTIVSQHHRKLYYTQCRVKFIKH